MVCPVAICTYLRTTRVLQDNLLVPIRLLINGASIAWYRACSTVTYYHVELDRHDILLAENLPAESYLDTGNSGLFENAGAPQSLHPDLTNDQQRRVAESCLPFAADPERVAPVWWRLAKRAVRLGLQLPTKPETTADPALCVVVNGRRIEPVSTSPSHIFVVPACDGEIWLISRAATPSDVEPWIDDHRLLGVRVGGITARFGEHVMAISLDDPSLQNGWWQPEWDGPTTLRRWTAGNAAISIRGAPSGPCLLEITVVGTLNYPLATDTTAIGETREAA